MSNKNKVIEKIKKCLALADGSDGNEAATALRQAQALMRKNGLTESHIKLSEITKLDTKRHKTQKPNGWQSSLISVIKRAFGVEAVILTRRAGYQVSFIGTDTEVELADYCYNVLYRKLEVARKSFMDELPKQTKRQNRISRADLYAQHWCYAVYSKLPTPPVDEERNELVSLYKLNQFDTLDDFTARTTKVRSKQDLESAYRGSVDGQQVDIHRPINGEQRKYAVLTKDH